MGEFFAEIEVDDQGHLHSNTEHVLKLQFQFIHIRQGFSRRLIINLQPVFVNSLGFILPRTKSLF